MLKRFLLVVLLLTISLTINTGAQAATLMPGVQAKMQQAEYWTNKPELQKVVLDSAQIGELNQKMQADKHIFALDKFATAIERKQMLDWIRELDYYEDQLYVKGRPMSSDLKKILLDSANMAAVPEKVIPDYGVTVRRTNVRTFPTAMGAFETAGDTHFDMFQETALDPGEPVLILHESKNKAFYFVHTRYYRGWISKADIAKVASRDKWLKYVNPQSFVVVTSSLLPIKNGNEEVLFQMGSVILLNGPSAADSFKILLPMRDAAGNLLEKSIVIKADGRVHKGYLTYTRANIIKQAFKMQGDQYGWGGLENSVDCSSMLQNVYRCVGLNIPRNGDMQEAVRADKVSLRGLSKDERLKLLNSLDPATALFSPTHVMLYIGTVNGKPYAIHSLGSYGRVDASGRIQKVSAMEVVVSDLLLTLGSGRTLIESLTSVVDYR